MAACDSLRSLFENSLPQKPKSLFESLTWNPHKPKKAIDSFTELFGELHFQEKHDLSSVRSPRFDFSESDDKRYRGEPKSNDGFSPSNSESLQLCTERLGSESSDDVEDIGGGGDDHRSDHEKDKGDGNVCLSSYSDVRRRRRGRGFPPPISSIGRDGKPWFCYKSFREGGRFVLREMRIPTREYLHASREDGRLKLQFVHPDFDVQDGDEDGQNEEEEEESTFEEQRRAI